MKAILMSIHPKWCEKIFNGEKTIEVRKTRPTTIIRLFEPPFMVYVYQTKRKWKSIVSEVLNSVYGGGKVIGSFGCDKVEYYEANERGWYIYPQDETCLLCDEIAHYGKGKTLSGWHIAAPKLFDKPKDITEFAIFGKCADECSECDFCARDIAEDRVTAKCFKRTFLKRPPQSWCYVEVENDT